MGEVNVPVRYRECPVCKAIAETYTNGTMLISHAPFQELEKRVAATEKKLEELSRSAAPAIASSILYK